MPPGPIYLIIMHILGNLAENWLALFRFGAPLGSSRYATRWNGAPSPGRTQESPPILQFPKNSMKLRICWVGEGGRGPGASLDPPMLS